jgi:hypothetical protein
MALGPEILMDADPLGNLDTPLIDAMLNDTAIASGPTGSQPAMNGFAGGLDGSQNCQSPPPPDMPNGDGTTSDPDGVNSDPGGGAQDVTSGGSPANDNEPSPPQPSPGTTARKTSSPPQPEPPEPDHQFRDCVKNVAEAGSIANLVGVDDSWLGNALLGNTWSGAVDAGEAIGNIDFSNFVDTAGAAASEVAKTIVGEGWDKLASAATRFLPKTLTIPIASQTTTQAVRVAAVAGNQVVVGTAISQTTKTLALELQLAQMAKAAAEVLGKVNVVKDVYDAFESAQAAVICRDLW